MTESSPIPEISKLKGETPVIEVCLSSLDEPRPGKSEIPGGWYVYGSDIAYKPDVTGNASIAATAITTPVVKATPPIAPTLVPPTNKTKKTSPKKRFCKFCGGEINAETRKCNACGHQFMKLKINWAILIVSLLLLASLILNAVLYSKYNHLNSDVVQLNKTVSQYKTKVHSLETTNSDLSDWKASNQYKINFIDRCVVFIEDDCTRYYHKYECDRFVGNHYWAHNIEYAEYLGYYPCPECH